MQRVITINLNGNAYQLDDSAYEALRTYLDLAAVQLKDNPDRAEILADLEQAIAEKCQRFLGPNKTVVSAAEIEQIVREMGPVEGADASSAHAETGSPSSPSDGAAAPRAPRRLYRIKEGAVWAGVCNGLAAYFGLDPIIVRIIFLVLTAATFGWWLIAYFILAASIPEAHTSDERAAAYGQPFNAQEIVDQVKKHAAGFADRDDWRQWKRQWREQRRQWRSQHRQWRRQWRVRTGPPPPWRMWNPVAGLTYATPVWAGILLPVLSIVGVALFGCLAFAVLSLLNTGAIAGWPLPEGIPLWAGILILAVLFQIVTSPLRAFRHASYAWRHPYEWLAVWDGLVGIGIAALFVWLVLRHMPPVHNFRELMQNLPDAFQALGRDVSAWLHQVAESF
jgi:phage shock protein PspC (stress-responsive transcriptional regulator)